MRHVLAGDLVAVFVESNLSEAAHPLQLSFQDESGFQSGDFVQAQAVVSKVRRTERLSEL